MHAGTLIEPMNRSARPQAPKTNLGRFTKRMCFVLGKKSVPQEYHGFCVDVAR